MSVENAQQPSKKRKMDLHQSDVDMPQAGSASPAPAAPSASGGVAPEFRGVDLLMRRASPFGSETGPLQLGAFAPGDETIAFVRTCRVLVLGAGGLGCELLKNLALSGFTQIDVIDMDSIDVSNLNRQFLFRAKDVGRMKAEVAAEFIMKRVAGCVVNHHTCPIQEKDVAFYRNFNVIIAGLDNIKARRWMNALLHEMVYVDENGVLDTTTIIPFVDGGTEGFAGQARVIVPKLTSCFECSLEAFPPQTHFPACTVAETPRRPEHCIAWAMFAVNQTLANPSAQQIYDMWRQQFGDAKLDKDSPDHMRFIFDRASERATAFGIEGVTYMLTMGVVKNIIPAIASTNALVAAACTNEAFKAMSWCSQSLNTYFQYNGHTGVYSHTFKYEKKEGCPVCDPKEVRVVANPASTLEEFIEQLKGDKQLQLEKPSLGKPGLNLFMQAPPMLREATLANLEKPLSELIEDGDVITVTDPVFPKMMAPVEVKVSFS